MSITFGDGLALIRREGHSEPIVANVLGRESDGQGETVYLDRLVHEPGHDWGTWAARGAVSTILNRVLPVAATSTELG